MSGVLRIMVVDSSNLHIYQRVGNTLEHILQSCLLIERKFSSLFSEARYAYFRFFLTFTFLVKQNYPEKDINNQFCHYMI